MTHEISQSSASVSSQAVSSQAVSSRAVSSRAISRRALLRAGATGIGAVALGPLVSGCGGSSSAKTTSKVTSTSVAGDGADAILKKAKAEGHLRLIAVSDAPDAYYRGVVAEFRELSGIDPTLDGPSMGSGGELDEVRKRKGRDDQVDVIDVGMTHAAAAAGEGLLVASLPDGWTDVPSVAKDPDGLWLCTYYGLVGIVVNRTLLAGRAGPATPQDLRKLPKGVQMGLPGDPRTNAAAGNLSSAEAFAAVWTVALALDGDFDDIGPGIDFFAELAHDGIFDPTAMAIPEVFSQGKLGVTMLNNFEYARTVALAAKADNGPDLAMKIIDAQRMFPNYYAQAAVAGSPHPWAAQAWLAYLLSPQGAKAFIKGGAIPTRLPALHAEGAVSDEDLAHITDLGISVKRLTEVSLPVPAQLQAAQKLVNERWGTDVKRDGT